VTGGGVVIVGRGIRKRDYRGGVVTGSGGHGEKRGEGAEGGEKGTGRGRRGEKKSVGRVGRGRGWKSEEGRKEIGGGDTYG